MSSTTKSREELKKYFETGDRPSEDQFAELIDSVVVQQSDEVWVDNNKNVRIGIGSPTKKLDVGGDIALQGHIHSQGGLALISNHPNNNARGIRIDERGRVQIGGEFNPDNPLNGPQDQLNVGGDVRLQEGDLFLKRDENDRNNGLGWYGPGKPFLTIANDDETDSTSMGGPRVRMQRSLLNNVEVEGPVLYGEKGGALGTKQSDQEKVALYWNDENKVGIGTTAPQKRLHVNGDAYIKDNVGIGTTSPEKLLHVNGDARIDGKSHIGSDALVTGKVGIGTDNPTEKLDVRGNAYIAYDINIDSTLKIRGQKPIRIEQFTVRNGDTAISTAGPDEEVIIVGYRMKSGGSSGGISVRARRRNTNWELQVAHAPATDEVEVDMMFIHKNIGHDTRPGNRYTDSD